MPISSWIINSNGYCHLVLEQEWPKPCWLFMTTADRPLKGYWRRHACSPLELLVALKGLHQVIHNSSDIISWTCSHCWLSCGRSCSCSPKHGRWGRLPAVVGNFSCLGSKLASRVYCCKCIEGSEVHIDIVAARKHNYQVLAGILTALPSESTGDHLANSSWQMPTPLLLHSSSRQPSLDCPFPETAWFSQGDTSSHQQILPDTALKHFRYDQLFGVMGHTS